MRVSGIGGSSRTGESRKTKKTGESGFVDQLQSVGGGGEVAGSAPLEASLALSGIGALLAVQAVDNLPGYQKSEHEIAAYGKTLLDMLETIRRDLILGDLSLEHLQNLRLALESWQAVPENPQLAEIIAEIRLRAAVELAKRE